MVNGRRELRLSVIIISGHGLIPVEAKYSSIYHLLNHNNVIGIPRIEPFEKLEQQDGVCIGLREFDVFAIRDDKCLAEQPCHWLKYQTYTKTGCQGWWWRGYTVQRSPAVEAHTELQRQSVEYTL